MRALATVPLDPPATPAELEAFPHHVVLSLPEREAIELLLRRRDLSPARQSELANAVAPLFARRLAIEIADPVRFLALLYCVAVGGRTVVAKPPAGART